MSSQNYSEVSGFLLREAGSETNSFNGIGPVADFNSPYNTIQTHTYLLSPQDLLPGKDACPQLWATEACPAVVGTSRHRGIGNKWKCLFDRQFPPELA